MWLTTTQLPGSRLHREFSVLILCWNSPSISVSSLAPSLTHTLKLLVCRLTLTWGDHSSNNKHQWSMRKWCSVLFYWMNTRLPVALSQLSWVQPHGSPHQCSPETSCRFPSLLHCSCRGRTEISPESFNTTQIQDRVHIFTAVTQTLT